MKESKLYVIMKFKPEISLWSTEVFQTKDNVSLAAVGHHLSKDRVDKLFVKLNMPPHDYINGSNTIRLDI